MTLGEKIKAVRIQNGMTQGELASRLNVSTNLVSKWENGDRNPSRESIEQVAAVLSVNVDYLLPEISPLVSLKVFEAFDDSAMRFRYDTWSECLIREKVPAGFVRNSIFNEDVTAMSQTDIDGCFFIFREDEGTLHVIKSDFTRIVDKQYYALRSGDDIIVRQLFKNPDGSFFNIHVDSLRIEKALKMGVNNLNSSDFSREDLIQKEDFTPEDASRIIGIVIATIRTITR